MNIYDIAEEAGVSITTVSRVLNNKSNVKYETRKRIEEVLNKHNYSPSPIARGLVSKNMNTVGILTIDVRVPHYAASAYILEHELYKIGYNAILCNTSGKAENGADYISMLAKKGVSGIVLIGSVFQNKQIEATVVKNAPNIPFISWNSQINAPNAYSVIINHENGMNLAINHLRDKGHRKIIYVQDAHTFSAIRKVDAFIKISGQHKDYPANRYVFHTERGILGGKNAVDHIMESGLEHSAIIFGDDTTASGGIQRLHQLGKKVPDDIAVIGWNNTESLLCEPNLTTVDNQNDTLGLICVKMLENILEGNDISPVVTIDSSLVIREST